MVRKACVGGGKTLRSNWAFDSIIALEVVIDFVVVYETNGSVEGQGLLFRIVMRATESFIFIKAFRQFNFVLFFTII